MEGLAFGSHRIRTAIPSRLYAPKALRTVDSACAGLPWTFANSPLTCCFLAPRRLSVSVSVSIAVIRPSTDWQRSGPAEGKKFKEVSQTFASWNQLRTVLLRIHALRQIA